MQTHQMNLRKEPFMKIKSGEKTIESRLYDEKRKTIKIGDFIIFKCTENDEEIKTEVKDLLLYSDFESMMNDLPPTYFGHVNKEDAIKEINTFYSRDEQAEMGVVGIRIVNLLR